MTTWKRIGGSFLAAAFLVGMSLGAPPRAEAGGGGHHGHYRAHGFVGVHLGYWGGPYWGAGWWGPAWWGPYWGPYWGYPYYPEGQVSMHAAMLAGYGAIKVDAKPKQAEVWADGKPIAEARDLDGTPSYLWLKAGEHRIQIYEGGFVTFDQKVDVHAGMRTELRVQLEPGPSVPPSGTAPETK
jgi:hypothetical protein